VWAAQYAGTWTHLVVTSPNVIIPNIWHHVVVRGDYGLTIKIFVDAYEEASAAWETSDGGNTEYRLDRGVSGEQYPGLIDEVHIYNRALSANEIKRRYELLR